MARRARSRRAGAGIPAALSFQKKNQNARGGGALSIGARTSPPQSRVASQKRCIGHLGSAACICCRKLRRAGRQSPSFS